MPAWWIGLDGRAIDLQTLAHLTTGSDCDVFEEDDRYFFRSSEIDTLSTATAARVEAEKYIDLLNGIARSEFLDHLPVSPSGVIHSVEPDGRRGVVIEVPTAHIILRSYPPTLDVGGKRSPSFYEVVTQVTRTDAAVRKVMHLFGSEGLDWRVLSNVLDIISVNISSKKNPNHQAIWNSGYASREEVKKFDKTANDPRLSGDQARHGAALGPILENPMSLTEGQALIQRILRDWIYSKSAKSQARDN